MFTSRVTCFYFCFLKKWVLGLKQGVDVPLPSILEHIYPFRVHNCRSLGYSVLKDIHPLYLTASVPCSLYGDFSSSYSFCLQVHFMSCKCRCFCSHFVCVCLECYLYIFTFRFSILFLMSVIAWSHPLINSSSQFLYQST